MLRRPERSAFACLACLGALLASNADAQKITLFGLGAPA
jgi:hypothetical protein